jgi:ubiquinone biosynthesis protein COQ9
MAMADGETRRALIEAMLPDVPFDGWSLAALKSAAARAGIDAAEAAALFPGGGADLIAGFSHWADAGMLAALARQDLAAMKVRDRIAAALTARLALLGPHREAVRRALALLALPQHLALGARLLYDTVDAVWYAAGDTATDFNFYTKRGLLAGVHAATTLYWLDDRSPGARETEAFLGRRLADVMAIPKLGKRLRDGLDWIPNPFRLMRVARRP